MSLLLFLSTDDSEPLHRRLIVALTEAITSSRLTPGSLVPSSRELAQSLGISRATVSKAYTELVRTGYLSTRAGGKTRVADSLPIADPQSNPAISPIHEVGKRIVACPQGEIDDYISSYAARLGEIGIVANWGVVDAAAPKRLLPIAQWKQILTKYCNELDSEKLSTHPFGEASFRTTIARFLYRSRAINCGPDQVITFLESQSGLNYISQVLIDEGDLVIVEDPCFVNARNIFLAHGAEVLSVPVDDQGLRIELLSEKISAGQRVKLIYVAPSFHDPTGVCMSLERRQKLLEFAEEHQALIVEDAWDGSHTFVKDVPPPLYVLSKNANVLYLCSFWKVLYPLSMVSCLIVPQKFIPYFEHAKMIAQEASPGIERTLEEFIETGLMEKHLKWVVRVLTPVRQNIIESLLQTFGQSVHIRKQSSAFWLTVQFDPLLELEEIKRKAVESGLVLVSTSLYYAEPSTSSKNEFIVHFASDDAFRDGS
jgi:GntR family transcriptional regulator/MocR family aminotransferase